MAVIDRRDSLQSDRLGRLPWVALGMAFGVLVVAIADAMARSKDPGAGALFWIGQITLYLVPAAMLVARRPVTRSEGLGIALAVPVATYAVLECYRPLQFDFLDEFAHVQTAQSILTTHHLFHANTLLPVSAQYPGLEIVTTALASLSHLSIDASGTVIAGVAHVLLGAALYSLVDEVTGRPRAGGLAVVIYATGPHFQFFDSYFIYEVIALPFLVASLLAVVKVVKAPDTKSATSWSVAAILAAFITVVSHHVTSYALIGLLVCFVVAALVVPGARRHRRHLVAVLAATVAMTLAWDLGIATDTAAYIVPQLQHVFSALNPENLFRGPTKGSGSYATPVADTVLELFGQLVLVALVIFGIVQAFRNRNEKHRALMLASAVASLALFVEIAIRLFLRNGSEIAARLSSYALLPIGLTIAAALRFPRPGVEHPPSRRARLHGAGARSMVLGAAVALAAGGVAGGWPASYARLPGPFLVGAWERSVDEHNLALSAFVRRNFTPANGVVSDFITAAMVAGLGHQVNVGGVASLFLQRRFTPRDVRLIEQKHISFVIVDKRISQQLPADGYYFLPDPRAGRYKTPIQSANLAKFNRIPAVSRIFDDGTISVYDVRQIADQATTRSGGR